MATRCPSAPGTAKGDIADPRAADARPVGCRLGGTGIGIFMAALMRQPEFGLGERDSLRSPAVDIRTERRLARDDQHDTVIAEFIRTRGITRCPTACVLPTQGSVDEADRAALEEHATAQERSRRAKAAARARFFWSGAASPRADA
jgi:hypothetical protein